MIKKEHVAFFQKLFDQGHLDAVRLSEGTLGAQACASHLIHLKKPLTYAQKGGKVSALKRGILQMTKNILRTNPNFTVSQTWNAIPEHQTGVIDPNDGMHYKVYRDEDQIYEDTIVSEEKEICKKPIGFEGFKKYVRKAKESINGT